MNRKLAASIGIIVVLLGYIFFSGRKGPKDVPDIGAWSGNATYFVMQKGDGSVFFQNENEKWLINEEKYPADQSLVKRLLDRIKNLKITDTISDKAFYEKYGLTPDKAATVTVKSGDRVLRKLMVGDAASTGRHTYIRLDDRTAVYQMAGTFSEDMNLNVEHYRDKEICNAVIDKISAVTLSYKGKTFNLYKKTTDVPATDVSKGEKKETKVKTKKEERWFCRELGDAPLDKGRMRSLLSSFSPLRASGFAAEKPGDLGKKTASVTLAVQKGSVTLSIYRHSGEKKYAVVSSESPYVFLLDEWKAKKYFIEKISEFRDNSKNKK